MSRNAQFATTVPGRIPEPITLTRLSYVVHGRVEITGPNVTSAEPHSTH